jgi:hypothetical protein
VPLKLLGCETPEVRIINTEDRSQQQVLHKKLERYLKRKTKGKIQVK